MRPTIQAVRQHYPAVTLREELFSDIGWNDLIGNKAYTDTCAIRMSYGPLRAGVSLPGARMKAKAGPLKGRFIEPGQARLSDILKRIWGRPRSTQAKRPPSPESASGRAWFRSSGLVAAQAGTLT